jgi:hypothetical protein
MKKLLHGLCSCTENPWDRSVVLPRNSCTDVILHFVFCIYVLAIKVQNTDCA